MKVLLHFRAIDRDIFLDIKQKKKTIETRAATKKYRGITSGDILVFICGKERLEKKIKKVRHFHSIQAMARAVEYKKILPSATSVAALRAMYFSFPGYKEKIKKFGIVAFWI